MSRRQGLLKLPTLRYGLAHIRLPWAKYKRDRKGFSWEQEERLQIWSNDHCLKLMEEMRAVAGAQAGSPLWLSAPTLPFAVPGASPGPLYQAPFPPSPPHAHGQWGSLGRELSTPRQQKDGVGKSVPLGIPPGALLPAPGRHQFLMEVGVQRIPPGSDTSLGFVHLLTTHLPPSPLAPPLAWNWPPFSTLTTWRLLCIYFSSCCVGGFLLAVAFSLIHLFPLFSF